MSIETKHRDLARTLFGIVARDRLAERVFALTTRDVGSDSRGKTTGIAITAVPFPAARADVPSGMESFRRGGDTGRAAIYQTLKGRIA